MLRPEFPIKTRRLVLRPFQESDLDAFADIQGREDVARYLYTGPRTRDEVEVLLRERVGQGAIEKPGDSLRLAVTLADSGTLIGDVVLVWRSAEHSSGEIGYVFHPDHHGHGYAGEAAIQVLRLGFEGLGLHRVYAELDADNRPSGRLLERLGMRFEGRFRESEFVKGRWVDAAVYAMLRDEWLDLTAD